MILCPQLQTIVYKRMHYFLSKFCCTSILKNVIKIITLFPLILMILAISCCHVIFTEKKLKFQIGNMANGIKIFIWSIIIKLIFTKSTYFLLNQLYQLHSFSSECSLYFCLNLSLSLNMRLSLSLKNSSFYALISSSFFDCYSRMNSLNFHSFSLISFYLIH